MRTQSLSLITLCGLLTGLGSVPLSGRAAEPNPSPALTNQNERNVPGQSLPATGKSNIVMLGTRDPKVVRLSVGLDDVVKLVKAGVDESVVLAFIQSSPVAYHPSAQEIIRLRELGISSPVITALLQRGEEIRVRAAEAQRELDLRNAPPATPAPPASQNINPPNSSSAAAPVAYPAVVYASSAYSYPPAASYRYGSAYYPPSYSCYPPVSYYGGHFPRASLSVGFGGGYGGIHFGGGYGGRHFGGGHGGIRFGGSHGGFRHSR